MQNRKAMGAKNDVKGLKPDVKGCARPFVFSRGKMPDSPEFKNSVCHSHNVAFTDNHINECIGRDACFDPLSGTLMPMATQDHVSGESVTGLKVTE